MRSSSRSNLRAAPSERVKKLFRAKARRRKQLARLPFEEKIQILLQLQKIAQTVRKDPTKTVWNLD